MATRNINNYINELLNEVHEPGHRRGDNVQIVKDRQAEMDRRRQEAEQEYASGRRFFDPTKNPMDGIRDDQKSTKKPLSSEERELAILRAQAKSRTNSMGERLAARKALKAMEPKDTPGNPRIPREQGLDGELVFTPDGFALREPTAPGPGQRRPDGGRPVAERKPAPGKTIGDMGKEMGKMRDGFLSDLDNFSSGKGITDNLQASGSGKKPKKDTPGREIEKIPRERRPEITELLPNPYYEPMAPGPGGRRPDDGRPATEFKPKYHDRRPDDGRYDDIPTYTKKPVMGQGNGKRRKATPDFGDPSRVTDERKERRQGDDLISARMNRGSNPQARPPRPGEKPRSLSGEIESDFIDYRKPKRMR